MNEYNVKKAVEIKRDFYNTGATKSVDFRISALKKLRDIIKKNEPAILRALRDDLKKPEIEAYLSEVYFSIYELDHAIKNLKRWSKPKRVKTSFINFPSKNYIYPEPYGVTLIISPWNYPFQLLISPLISSIAAGNCSVLKPSEISRSTSNIIAGIINDDFPGSFISVVEGDAEVSRALLAEKFDHIFYTGGSKVGKIVMEAASKHLTPVTLELGGKSPCIVDENVNLDESVKRIILGKFFNAGQTCVAPDYLLVHKNIKLQFTAGIKERLRDFYTHDPAGSPDYGRIINKSHYKRLIDLADESSWTLGSHDENGLMFAPTLVENIPYDHPLMNEEIFGPILPILEFSDISDAVSIINSKPKPLALYIFSKDNAFAEQVLRQTSSGGVCINDTIKHITEINLPFGGVGNSGMGVYRGIFGFKTFSHMKSVMKRPFYLNFFSSYPPYGESLKKIRKFLG
jgi:acyl-CoA reductase-like NAD-dependent aldehyde dehydrogenase